MTIKFRKHVLHVKTNEEITNMSFSILAISVFEAIYYIDVFIHRIKNEL